MRFSTNHDAHDRKWMFSVAPRGGGTGEPPVTCFACAMELLENPDILMIRKKPELDKLVKILNSNNGPQVAQVLKIDVRIALHMALLLLGLTECGDQIFMTSSIEAVVKMVCLVESEELVCCVMDSMSQESLRICNYKKSVPVLLVVGKLLTMIPPLAAKMLHSYGSFVDYIALAVGYADEEVQMAACYIWVQLYSSATSSNLPEKLNRQLSHNVLNILINTQCSELLLNALGVMKAMLLQPSGVESLIGQTSSNNASSPLGAAVKKLLMWKEEPVRIATAQCVSCLVSGDKAQLCADTLLADDVAEFLFEALSTSNELLLSALFACILHMTSFDSFFHKCHAVYGIEAILRAVDLALKLKNQEIIHQGVALLSNILERQPGDIRLFSSSGAVEQCAGVITQALQLSCLRTVIEGASALKSLFRKEHMTSPVPYGCLMTSLTVVMEKLHGLPRLSCVPGSTPLGKNLRRSHSRSDHRATRAENTQKQLNALVSVVHQAARLCVQCKEDPFSDSRTFTKPSESGKVEPSDGGGDRPVTSLKDVATLLVNNTTQLVLPSVMGNLCYISEGVVVARLLQTLNQLHLLETSTMTSFYSHLVQIGFLGDAFVISAKFSKDAGDDLSTLLSNVCVRELDLDSGDKEDLKVALRKGLQEIKGTAADLAMCMTQNSAEPPDVQLQCAQWACLCLNYTCAKYSKSLVEPALLHRCLQTYIQLHSGYLGNLPEEALQYLVFLFAISSPKDAKETRAIQTENAILSDLLGRLEVRHWGSRHRRFLDWCFSSSTLGGVVGGKLLIWLLDDDFCRTTSQNKVQDITNSEDTSNEVKCGDLVSLATENQSCLQALLTIFEDEQRLERVVVNAAAVLQELVTSFQGNHDNHAILDTVRNKVALTLHKILLRSEPSGGTVEALLIVLTQIKKHEFRKSLSEIDSKIAYHVINRVTKETDDAGYQGVCLEFLNCLLIQSANNDDKKVASMIVARSEFLHFIQEHLTSRIYTAQIYSLLALLVYHNGSKIKEAPLVTSTFQRLLTGLQSHSLPELLPCIQMWTALFHTGQWASVIQLVPERSEPDLGHMPQYRPGYPNQTVLRLLMLALQHCLFSEHRLIQEAVVTCLEYMLDDVIGHDLLRRHLVSQPWFHLVLVTNTRSSPPPNWLLHLVFLLLKYESKVLRKQYVQELIETVSSADLSEETCGRRLVVAQLVEMAKRHEYLPNHWEGLELSIDELKAEVNKSKPFISLITVDGVVIPIIQPQLGVIVT